MELGTPAWLAAVSRVLNDSEDYRRSASGWRWPLGLAFLPGDDPDRSPRYGILDLHEGHCTDARPTDRRGFEHAPFRLSATYRGWCHVLDEGADPMRCILVRELDLAGDRLTALRYLPAAKALLHAVATIDRDVTAA